MDPISALGLATQAVDLYNRFKEIYIGIRDAPEDISRFATEAECLQVCLAVFTYDDCQRALKCVRKGQLEDLDKIMKGCERNSEEMLVYVRQIQRSVAEASHPGVTKKRDWLRWFMRKAKDLYHRYDFAQTDKQPMRNKMTIPLQSLNIFLVSLTFTMRPFNPQAPPDPEVKPVKLGPEWAAVGQVVAFKNVDFDAKDLAVLGVETRIINAARCIVNGYCTSGCQPCCSCTPNSSLSDVGDGVVIPRRPPDEIPTTQRKPRAVSKKVYVVRNKSKGRGSTFQRVTSEVLPLSRRQDDSSDRNQPLPRLRRASSPLPIPGRRRRPRSTSPSPHYEQRPSVSGNGNGADMPGHQPWGHATMPGSPPWDLPDGDEYLQRERMGYVPQTVEDAVQEGQESARRAIKQARRQADRELEQGVMMTEQNVAETQEARRRSRRERRARAEMELNADLQQEHSPGARRRMQENMRERLRLEGDLERLREDLEDPEDRPGVQTYMRMRYGLEIWAVDPQTHLIRNAFQSHADNAEIRQAESMAGAAFGHGVPGHTKLDIGHVSDDNDDDGTEVEEEMTASALPPDRMFMEASPGTSKTSRTRYRQDLFTISPQPRRSQGHTASGSMHADRTSIEVVQLQQAILKRLEEQLAQSEAEAAIRRRQRRETELEQFEDRHSRRSPEPRGPGPSYTTFPHNYREPYVTDYTDIPGGSHNRLHSDGKRGSQISRRRSQSSSRSRSRPRYTTFTKTTNTYQLTRDTEADLEPYSSRYQNGMLHPEHTDERMRYPQSLELDLDLNSNPSSIPDPNADPDRRSVRRDRYGGGSGGITYNYRQAGKAAAAASDGSSD